MDRAAPGHQPSRDRLIAVPGQRGNIRWRALGCGLIALKGFRYKLT
jgi:hypothetical protein